MFELLITIMLFSGSSQHSTLPQALRECIRQNPTVKVNRLQQPLYLKVFFTGAKKADYVIVVKEEGSELNRALVCTPGGKATILGSKSASRPFSTMESDDYMSSKWRVCKKKEVEAMKKYYSDVPDPANESICLLWEDGEGLIYSNGRSLLWKSLEP
jgi:hypothetical protein